MKHIIIPNYEKFQFYHDGRNLLWIKVLVEIIDQFDKDGAPKKFYTLPDVSQLNYIKLLCLRSRYNEKIPYPNDSWLKEKLGVTDLKLQPLEIAGFIELVTDLVQTPTDLVQVPTKQSHKTKTKTETKTKKEKGFQPPTLGQVISYCQENNLNVDVLKFMNYYNKTNWHKANKKPLRDWKMALSLTWHDPNGQRKTYKCRICQKPACYTTGEDDSGQIAWFCEDHKPKIKTVLPAELLSGFGREVKDPKVDINARRNKLKDQLEVK